MQTDRDRLVELCNQKINTMKFNNSDHWFDFYERITEMVDHLLANGVIVPPCKVGDTIYYPWVYDEQSGIAFNEVESFLYNQKPIIIVKSWGSDIDMPVSFTFESIGKTVFLTKEEAKNALVERSGDNC